MIHSSMLMNTKFQLDSTGRLIFMTIIISFNGYLLSLMNVIEPYNGKVSEIFESKDVEQVYIFNKKLFITRIRIVLWV